jgi:hypothetical protein
LDKFYDINFDLIKEKIPFSSKIINDNNIYYREIMLYILLGRIIIILDTILFDYGGLKI